MSVFANSLLVTITRKKAVETAKTAEAIEIARPGKDGKKSKSGMYPKNLA